MTIGHVFLRKSESSPRLQKYNTVHKLELQAACGDGRWGGGVGGGG